MRSVYLHYSVCTEHMQITIKMKNMNGDNSLGDKYACTNISESILYSKRSAGQAVNKVSHHVSQLSAVLLYKWKNNFKIL